MLRNSSSEFLNHIVCALTGHRFYNFVFCTIEDVDYVVLCINACKYITLLCASQHLIYFYCVLYRNKSSPVQVCNSGDLFHSCYHHYSISVKLKAINRLIAFLLLLILRFMK